MKLLKTGILVVFVAVFGLVAISVLVSFGVVSVENLFQYGSLTFWLPVALVLTCAILILVLIRQTAKKIRGGQNVGRNY